MVTPNVSGVAFVTGGARGLGNAIAVAFAREGCKAVVLVDVLAEETMRKGQKAVEIAGAKCLTINCDVTKESEVEFAIAQTIKEFGRIDYAANFAGITGDVNYLEDTSFEGFEKTLRVNTTGVFLCTKHQLIQMSKQEPVNVEGQVFSQRGSIVNCASVNGIQAAKASGAYTASKHAVIGISKTAALEARSRQIRVNSVSPGFVWTDMVAGIVPNHPDPKLREAWGQFEARQGRKVAPQDIADATVLLSSAKMGVVNAHNLVCDNGFVMNEYND